MTDLIGIVEYVQDSTFTVIERNKENKVARRTITIGWGYIRGFAAPKYEEGYNYKEVQQRVNELTKGEYVTVNPGDTLSKIAEIHRTSVAEILNLNSTLIKNPGSIRVGWKIKVK